jgi:hypothetical protein
MTTHKVPLVRVRVSWATSWTVDSWGTYDRGFDVAAGGKDDFVDVPVPGLVREGC